MHGTARSRRPPDDRSVRRIQGAGQLPAHAQGALRHRRQPVRRPRRGDQHHAAHPAGHGRRGDPPGAQPLGRRGGDRGAAGRRAGHRRQQLPGRAQRVLHLHGRAAQGPRRRAHPGVRRWRRRDRAGRDPDAGRPRRAHLQPRGRPAHGPGRHDRRDGDARRPRPDGARAHHAVGHPGPHRGRMALPGPTDHRAGERQGLGRTGGRPARRRQAGLGPGAGHHRHRRRGQEQPDRRADPPHPPGPGRRAAHRGDQH